MDMELFEAITGHDAFSAEELDSKRRERIGEGLDELGQEWYSMLQFEYQMEDFDSIRQVVEFGATTTTVCLYFHVDDIAEPHLEDQALLDSMMRHKGEIGQISRYIHLDDSLVLDAAGKVPDDDNLIVLYVSVF